MRPTVLGYARGVDGHAAVNKSASIVQQRMTRALHSKPSHMPTFYRPHRHICPHFPNAAFA